MRVSLLGGFLLALLVVLESCYQPPNPSTDATSTSETTPTTKRETAISGDIHIAVDETFQPIIQSLLDTYKVTYPDANIQPHYLPGEEAIHEMLTSDSMRLVVATRELTKSEKQILINKNTSAKTFPLATDAIALIVSKSNKDTVLTQSQLQGILKGEITTWKQINPDSPLDSIRVVFDHPLSSTYQYLRDEFMGGVGPRGSAMKNNLEVVDYVGKQNKNALGVIGLAWISDSDSQQAIGFKRDITVCKIDNPNRDRACGSYGTTYQPYQGLIKLGCYPLTRSVIAISRETRFGLGTGFINYAVKPETGQRLILKSGLVPAYGVPRIVQFPAKK